MKVLQVMSGAERGGAEEFFVRLAAAFSRTSLSQKAVIRDYPDRVDKLVSLGVETKVLPFGRWLDFRTLVTLKTIIEDWEPDVVLSWMSRATEICSKVLPRSGPVHVGRMGGYYKLKYFRKCHHLIGNTMGMVRYIGDLGWPENNIHYLPNFVSSSRSLALDRDLLATPRDAPLLLGLGRLHRNKAFDVLLDALALLPDHWLWIAGSGPEEQALKAQARQLGIEKRVRFLGWRQDVGRLFASVDTFVCASREEPLGNMVIESWAQEVPVVAAAAAGPTELITHEVNGLLCPINDASQMAQAIAKVHGSMVQSLCSEGWQQYQKFFSEQIVVDKYLNFFESVKQ
jgi:glycosyltransferase involved in cell wall biosynthesis